MWIKASLLFSGVRKILRALSETQRCTTGLLWRTAWEGGNVPSAATLIGASQSTGNLHNFCNHVDPNAPAVFKSASVCQTQQLWAGDAEHIGL